MLVVLAGITPFSRACVRDNRIQSQHVATGGKTQETGYLLHHEGFPAYKSRISTACDGYERSKENLYRLSTSSQLRQHLLLFRVRPDMNTRIRLANKDMRALH